MGDISSPVVKILPKWPVCCRRQAPGCTQQPELRPHGGCRSVSPGSGGIVRGEIEALDNRGTPNEVIGTWKVSSYRISPRCVLKGGFRLSFVRGRRKKTTSQTVGVASAWYFFRRCIKRRGTKRKAPGTSRTTAPEHHPLVVRRSHTLTGPRVGSREPKRPFTCDPQPALGSEQLNVPSRPTTLVLVSRTPAAMQATSRPETRAKAWPRTRPLAESGSC